ncbi:metallophosphoesterase [Mucilaginibacter sp. CSA2-8R]|uniref:metallophosphoesterase family protein n=1 Tax=Mucilaginibacter sp. CSA2-8R TaxID=3141542 RepID=UPI00315DC611
MSNTPLLYAHLGDLHITQAKEQNYTDLLSIIAQLETECAGKLDFVYLPGDNADNGLPQQYRLVATALKMLSVPVHIITGDHDMEQGSLDNFYRYLSTEKLPKAVQVKRVRCLFLNVCGPGTGGPDFKVAQAQMEWLRQELQSAQSTNQNTIIFTHTYPDDLTGDGETQVLNQLIAEYKVTLVDMGHTHYNELANNGQTIFAATRSTGQIEEGPVGYTLVSADDGVVSWRFKPLHDAFPLVMITSPADYRLKADNAAAPNGITAVRAVVFGHRNTTQVACSTDGAQWHVMSLSNDGKTWLANVDLNGAAALTVKATDASNRPAVHTIELQPPAGYQPVRKADGSDADSIGAWPQNGIFGTQLGPNRNGKPS